MAKSLCAFVLALCLVASVTAEETEVKGSITAGIMLPQMELPHSNAWVIELNAPHKKMGHEGELGEITPNMGFTIGYGVSFGEYSRFDATVGNMQSEYEAKFTGEVFGESFERTFMIRTHTVPIRFDYTMFTPGFWGDRIKPEFGFGLIFFIAKYQTDQEIRIADETSRGTAWARGVTVGPELRAGVEIAIFDGLAAEVYGTYFTTVMDLDRWYTYDFAETGPTIEEYTGWAIWLGPRFYLP
jgi:hypothetical protein